MLKVTGCVWVPVAGCVCLCLSVCLSVSVVDTLHQPGTYELNIYLKKRKVLMRRVADGVHVFDKKLMIGPK